MQLPYDCPSFAMKKDTLLVGNGGSWNIEGGCDNLRSVEPIIKYDFFDINKYNESNNQGQEINY